ncbi:ABC transporter permease [Thermostichus vulcanus]|uniref:ABC transporter permease n=1 Tax=Thermostichus vulcanus str. 'Rupite' TaxID=2813851 RepID=A0ABT0CB84_THEVL|nr:ABC transporter permease [Thermostichus vulcanus]MCJ2543046.1 ABC transporter permease [Thermostichus vulcanus str. 'Rupite']
MAFPTSAPPLAATPEDASSRATVAVPLWVRAWRRFRANRLALLGLGYVVLLLGVALFADHLAPYSPVETFAGMRGRGPSVEHWLGFDHVGRDLLSRLIFGTRAALIVGLGATGIAVTVGVLVGSLSGYFGGWVDLLLSRLVDTLMAFPTLALLIMLAAVLGPSLLTTVTVIGLTSWAAYARVVRADVLSLRERDFVMAAYAGGAKSSHILWHHILPNVLGPVIVLGSLGVGSTIILESALSFLGLGIRPPAPSWGGILSDGRAYILTYPHIAIAPGVLIVLTVLAFNFIGDGLRDALDPRQRG